MKINPISFIAIILVFVGFFLAKNSGNANVFEAAMALLSIGLYLRFMPRSWIGYWWLWEWKRVHPNNNSVREFGIVFIALGFMLSFIYAIYFGNLNGR